MAQVKQGKLSAEARRIAKVLGGGPASASGGSKSRAKNGGGSPGLLDSLKNIGSTSLDVLTVPGAVTVTSLTNAIQAIKGDPLVSWKNLGGTFRDEKYAGGAGLLRSLGVSNKNAELWGGLGLDIVLDPLWLTGLGALNAGAKFGTTASKIAAAERAAGLARGARHGHDAAKLSESLGKTNTASSQFFSKAVAADTEKALAKQHGITPALRFGFGRKVVDGDKVRRGPQVPLWHKPILKKDPTKTAPTSLSLSPLGGVVARGQDRARAVGDLSAAELRKALSDEGIDDRVLGAVGAMMLGKTPKLAETSKAVENLRAAGVWTPKHDRAVEILEGVGKRQAEQFGWVTHAEQGAAMQRWLVAHTAGMQEEVGKLSRLAARSEASAREAVARLRAISVERGQKLTRNARTEKAAAQAGVERLRQAAEVAGARHAGAAQEVRRLEALGALRGNDPAYAARITKSVRGRRDMAGWSPKKAAREAASARRKGRGQRLAKQRKLEALYKEVHVALETQLKAGEKGLERMVKRIDIKANRDRLAVMDDFAKLEREAVALHGKRTKSLDKALSSFIKDQEKLAGEARAMAASEKLYEFTPARKYRLKNGELVPLKGKPAPLSLSELHETAIALMDRGAYIQHAPDPDMLADVRNFMAKEFVERRMTPDIMRSAIPGASKALKKRTARNPYEVTTAESTVESLMKSGVPEDEALLVQEELGKVFKFADEAMPYSKENIPNIMYRPDLNGYSMVAGRERDQYNMLLQRDVTAVLRALFPAKTKKEYTKMWEDLTTQYATKRIPGAPASFLGYAKRVDPRTGKKVQSDMPRISLATAWLKAWFTVMNPGHYVLNAVGSYINDFIEGNWRHAARGFGPNLPKHPARALGKADLEDSEAMARVWKLGKQELTGLQLATYARLSGLGIGYTQAEIEMVAHIFESTGKVTGVARAMNKLNMTRENADRVWSWMNHIKSGDDPFTAAAKVLRTKFDYNAATHFERIWARNLLLFYTWYKNNLVLQGYGLLAKPGIYSTMRHIENSRPKDPAEPSWWPKAGGLYSPAGLLTFGNPLADVHKYALTQENLRKNVLGALTPFAQTPISLATGKDMFTGAALSKFADQNVPSPAGYLLNPIGIGTESRAMSEGERSPAVPWYIAKILKDFTGPYGSSLSATISNPDREANAAFGIVPRLTGVRLNPKEPEKWARSLKARETKRKAEATRKRNYEKP